MNKFTKKIGFTLVIVITFIAFLFTPTVKALVSNLVDFNDTTDLTDFFNSDGSVQFTNGATGGIGNTGAINVPNGTTDIWTTKQGYSVSGAGDIYTFSAFFKINANSGYGGLGFSNVDTNTGDFSGQPSTGIGMSFHGGGGSFVNNRVYTNVSWPPDLVLGNWYKMIFKVTAKGSNTYDLNFQIWNSDANGTLGTMKTEKTLDDVVNSSLGGSSIIHGFFAAAGSRMEKIDDFLIELEGDAGFVEEGTPVVITTAVTSVTGTTASSGGNVTDDQGASVTARGVCWNTVTVPTTSHTCTTDGTGTGSYTSSITGLSGTTTYYLRSYATNSIGTSYGNEYSFTTSAAPTPTPTPTPTPSPSPTPTTTPSQVSVNTTSTNSDSPPPTCTDQKPNGTPDLFRIDTTYDKATINFAAIQGIYEYHISYGTNQSADAHSVSFNVGEKWVESYTINYLQPNTTYYFKVRGQNGCTPGDWTESKSASTIGEVTTQIQTKNTPLDKIVEAFDQNTLPEKKLEIVSTDLTMKESNVCKYLVQSGDSLWSIAQNKLGNGARFTDLKELNELSNELLNVNQELKLPCDTTDESIAKATEEVKQEGTKLDILVKDSNDKPLGGVHVTLHSKVQEATTDENGIAKFQNVEPGDHRVILAYDNYKGEQKLTVNGEQREQILTLQVQMNNGFSTKLAWTLFIVMGIIITILSFILIILLKRRKKHQDKHKM